MSFEEFSFVIQNLASDYSKDEADYILVKDLELPRPKRGDDEREGRGDRARPDGDRDGPPGRDRNQSSLR